MKAVVVYESAWGNTAAVAKAIAEGIGPNARALSTAEATPEAIDGVNLVVAGSPLFAFRRPTERVREGIRKKAHTFSTPPDLSHPSLRSWLERLPAGQGHAAAFETRIGWSPGGAAGATLNKLVQAGYASAGRVQRFKVTGLTGPLKPGEIERAREWGAELARVVQADG